MNYEDFLASKALTVAPVGFEPAPFITPLFDFQADIVRMGCRLGRFCCWSDCGTGKSIIFLEWAHQICEHTGGRVLILAPLAVSHQIVREAVKFGVPDVAYASRQEYAKSRIVVTNYQKLQHFSADEFIAIVTDEASILKSFSGAIRNQIIETFARTPYRFAASATPSPNDIMELGNQSEFLGIMTRVEMLSMFFVHDGGDTSQWRLKGHAQQKFWEWVCTWAVTLRKPSDLGYEDKGFILPPLHLVDHVVETPLESVTDKNGQVGLFAMQAQTLSDQRAVQRSSLGLRVAEAIKLANSNNEQWLVWCFLNDESKALAAGIRGGIEICGADTDEFKEQALLNFQDGKLRVLITKASIAGFGLNLQNCHNVIFVGLSHSFESWYQSIRRCWRFGQKSPVTAHIVYDWAEGAVIENTRRKEAEADKMAISMVQIMKDKSIEFLKQTKRDVTEYEPRVGMQVPEWLRSEA